MPSRFRHVLVPLDFTQKNQTALEIAAEIANTNAARITLLHVVERFEETAEDDETEEFYEKLRQRAEEELQGLSKSLVHSGLVPEYRLRTGRRAAEIIEFVNQEQIDLIVLSSHQIDTAEPMKSLATLSYQVSILAPCPVMLVK